MQRLCQAALWTAMAVTTVTDGFSQSPVDGKDRVEAAEALNQFGVRFIPDDPRAPVRSIWLGGGRVGPTDETLPLLLAFPEITELRLVGGGGYRGANVTDDGLRQLASLKNLEKIDIGSMKMTGEGLKYLASLPRLKGLEIWGLQLTPDGLRSLAEFEQLETLGLSGHLPANVLTNLEGMQNLRYLSTLLQRSSQSNEPTLGDASLEPLRSLPALDAMTMIDVPLSDEGMRILAQMPGLKTLNLYDAPITDEGLKNLSGHPGMERLTLSRTDVTDDGIRHLAAWKSLKEIGLGDNKNITGTGLQYLSNRNAIEQVKLVGPAVDDFGLTPLAAYIGMKHLQIGAGQGRENGKYVRPKITNKGLTSIQDLPSLSYVHLVNTGVTDAGLWSLVTLPALESVSIFHTPGVTEAGVEEFRKAYPRVRITVHNIRRETED